MGEKLTLLPTSLPGEGRTRLPGSWARLARSLGCVAADAGLARIGVEKTRGKSSRFSSTGHLIASGWGRTRLPGDSVWLARSLENVAADAGGARIGVGTAGLRDGSGLTENVGAEHARPVGPHTRRGSARFLAQQGAVPGSILAPWSPPRRPHPTAYGGPLVVASCRSTSGDTTLPRPAFGRTQFGGRACSAPTSSRNRPAVSRLCALFSSGSADRRRRRPSDRRASAQVPLRREAA